MSALGPKTSSTAVMARRAEPADSLDDFPTPPWASRALFECVFPHIGVDLSRAVVWEPAANRGLMARAIAPYVYNLHCSDVMDYGLAGADIGSFVGSGPDVARAPAFLDAVITNPPFRLAIEFFERAVEEAPLVALLLRTAFVEGADRYRRIFEARPPSLIAFFSERCSMVKGGWDPDASTATSYSWFVWSRGHVPRAPYWIPPGQRARLTHRDDLALARRLGALKSVAPQAEDRQETPENRGFL